MSILLILYALVMYTAFGAMKFFSIYGEIRELGMSLYNLIELAVAGGYFATGTLFVMARDMILSEHVREAIYSVSGLFAANLALTVWNALDIIRLASELRTDGFDVPALLLQSIVGLAFNILVFGITVRLIKEAGGLAVRSNSALAVGWLTLAAYPVLALMFAAVVL